MAAQSVLDRVQAPFVSTGHLPRVETMQFLGNEACRRFKSDTAGKNSDGYTGLARIPSGLFGVRVTGTSGRAYGAGGMDYDSGTLKPRRVT